MALYNSGAPAIKKSRSTSKNKYVVYPVTVEGVVGTGTFVELTKTETWIKVALTKAYAEQLQTALDGLSLAEPGNIVTTGRIYEENSIVESWVAEATRETKITRRVGFIEGIPSGEPAAGDDDATGAIEPPTGFGDE